MPEQFATPHQLVIVDDDDAGRRMLRRALERKGYSIAEASDGEAGLELIRATLPAAALLDLRMPGRFSGFDVIRQLHADAATADIPLIARKPWPQPPSS